MTEAEYINATNLVKLNLISDLMNDLLINDPTEQDELAKAAQLVDMLVELHQNRITVKG